MFAPTGALPAPRDRVGLGRSRRVLDLSQPGDGYEHLFPQSAGDRDLGQLEGDRARMANRLRADLDQPLAQAGQRPVRDLGWQSQGAQEIAEVIGECVELEANGVGSECPARQACAWRNLIISANRPHFIDL